MKVPELKKLLAEKGLAQTGNKADLIARLQENDKTAGDEPGSLPFFSRIRCETSSTVNNLANQSTPILQVPTRKMKLAIATTKLRLTLNPQSLL